MHFIENWSLIPSEPRVCQTVTGYHIKFTQIALPPPLPFSQDEILAMDDEIQSLKDKQAIHEAPLEGMEAGFVSSLFMVPKKGGGQRPVINLKGLNNYLEYFHFKMEGIQMLRDLLRKRRLYVGIGPQGYLFHGFNLVTSPEISKNSMEDNNVEICVPPLWLCQCSKSLYQNNETSGGLVAQMGVRLIVRLDDI